MSSLTSKRMSLVALVIVTVVALSSVAILTQPGGKTSSTAGSSTTSSTNRTSSSTTTLSSISGAFIGFSQVYPALYAMPGLILNYSITISQFEPTASSVTVSAVPTVPGVTVTVKPSHFTFFGDQEAIVLGVSIAPTVNATILPVKITASTANGAVSETFDFRLNKALVVVLPDAGLTPRILHVGVGQGVTWLDLLDPGDEGNGQANVLLADGTPPSTTLGLYDVWSHTFTKTGTYPYQVTLNGYVTQNATLVVG